MSVLGRLAAAKLTVNGSEVLAYYVRSLHRHGSNSSRLAPDLLFSAHKLAPSGAPYGRSGSQSTGSCAPHVAAPCPAPPRSSREVGGPAPPPGLCSCGPAQRA